MLRILGVLVLVLLVAPTAPAAEDDLDRANKLRDEATTDWHSKRHEAAIEKLRRADAIYANRPGDYSAGRAVVLRAIAWNQSRLGLHDEILKTWHQLALLTKGKDGLHDNLFSAYTAFAEAAVTKEDTAEMLALLDRIRKQAQELGYDRIAAQVLHDEGYHLRRREMPGEALVRYEKAAAERLEIGDDLGRAWSLVCIANLYVTTKRIDEALEPLLGAYRLIHTEAIADPQASLAWNLRAVLTDIEARDEIDKKTAAWIAKMTGVALVATQPLVVPADRLLRLTLVADPTLKGAQKLLALGLSGLRREVQADLWIRAALVAYKADGAVKAMKWLETLDPGESPVGLHLDARRRTALALVHAENDFKEDFLREAVAAANAWKNLGDRGGREKALGELVTAARALKLEAEAAAIIEEDELLRASGKPGGAGGSASSGGNQSGYSRLGLHDPLFAVTFEKGKIRLQDLVAERKAEFDLAWKPRNASLNGLTITVFGGYVRIKMLSYGGAAISTGAPGSITLDRLGEYLPVPEEGRLLILKNGAVRYETK
jgi:tetratricopeptide (TPR) repeat protein